MPNTRRTPRLSAACFANSDRHNNSKINNLAQISGPPAGRMITLCLLSFAACVTGLAQDRTSTGFFYPRSSNIGPYADFLDSSCGSENLYLPDMFHLGKDSWAFLGEAVYAIADGEVVWRSVHGWIYNQPSAQGDGITSNIALLIKHKTSQGFWVQAVYGHILTQLQIGDQVRAGQQIGTVGPYGVNNNGTHVHFGMRIPLQQNGSDYPIHFGNASCSEWPLPAADRWVDPVKFITTRAPDNYLGGSTSSTGTGGSGGGGSSSGQQGGSTAGLQETFNPSPAYAYSNPNCSTSNGTAYSFTVTLAETQGVGLTPSGLNIDGSTSWVPGGFSSHIAPHGTASFPLYWCRYSGSSTWVVSATDDNGHAVTATATVQMN